MAARRSWIIEQLPALVHNPSIPKSDDWIQTVLEWLLVNGLFVVTKASQKSSYRPVCITSPDDEFKLVPLRLVLIASDPAYTSTTRRLTGALSQPLAHLPRRFDQSHDHQQSRQVLIAFSLTSHHHLLTSCSIDDNKTIKLSAAASDGEYWVSKVIDTIGRLEKDTKHVSLLHDADEVDISLRQHARETIISLREVR